MHPAISVVAVVVVHDFVCVVRFTLLGRIDAPILPAIHLVVHGEEAIVERVVYHAFLFKIIYMYCPRYSLAAESLPFLLSSEDLEDAVELDLQACASSAYADFAPCVYHVPPAVGR